MTKPDIPQHESDRIKTLKRYDILDSLPEQIYDDITFLASRICETPIALISFVDTDRQWFKSRVGLDTNQTSRDHSFCAHAINNPSQIMVVKDALNDSRFSDNPLVLSDPKIRFYAGSPLVTQDGLGLGTLCVIDKEPKELNDNQLKSLAALSRQISAHLEIRLSNIKMEKMISEKDKFFSILAHDLRHPFQGILGITDLLSENPEMLTVTEIAQFAKEINIKFENLYKLLTNLLEWSNIQIGNMKYSPVLFDLYPVVKDIIELSNLYAIKKNIHISTNVMIGTNVFADVNMVSLILRNLVSNSIKFSHPNGKIDISITPNKNDVNISIRDNGVGLTDEKIREILNNDFTESTSGTEKETGSGLGLTLCKELISINKSYLDIKSVPGEGATFSFSLPIQL